MGGAEGQASDIAITAQHILKVKENLNKILAKNTGKPIAQVEKDSDRDYYMSATEAKNYGIVDEIYKPKGNGK
jgi:ATP-dependent Clp protease protease subunit